MRVPSPPVSIGRPTRRRSRRCCRRRGREKLVEEFRGTELKLDARPRRSISIDGEVLARVPVTVRVAERAIDVVVPG